MANSLILFTPRTGSSILADLLAFKYGAWNLDEILSHQIRPMIINRLPSDVKARIRQGNFNARVNLQKKSPETFYEMMHSEIMRALNFTEELSQENDIVIKCYTYPAALPRKIIESAIDKKFEIYFLYRSNIEEQMKSMISAMMRENQPDVIQWSGHVHTNNTNTISIPPQEYSKRRMHNMAFQIGNAIHTWNVLHQHYKHYGVTMCYEDTIAKGDFSLAGIDSNLINAYQSQNEFLVPTKNKVKNFITNWEELKPIVDSYIIYK